METHCIYCAHIAVCMLTPSRNCKHFADKRRDKMKLFSWQVTVGYQCIADGYLLAENRAEAEEKLSLVPFHNNHEEITISEESCGYDGCEINRNGIIIRWED